MVIIWLIFIFLGNICKCYMECPSDWKGIPSVSSCYIYVNVPMKVDDARQHCYDEYKAVLAMPKTQEENNFLISINTADVFIGMTDMYEEGSFEYFDGDSVQQTTAMFSYNPWDTITSSWYDHVVMTVVGTWKPANANVQRAFWCQKDFTISDTCTDLGWFKDTNGEMCYKQSGYGSYVVAVDTCETAGYDILMPKSLHQHKFLRWFISEYINKNVWIGITDIEEEGSFKWHRGNDTGFRAFTDGEPDNLFNNQDCVRYDDQYADFDWNDFSCTESATIVCQAFASDFDIKHTISYDSASTDMTDNVIFNATSTKSTPAELSSDSTNGVTRSAPAYTTNTVVLNTVSTSFFSTDNCQCPCSSVNNKSDIWLYIEKLNQELKVDVEQLSSTIRSKTCADDPRESSKYIGAVGGVILATIFTAVVLADAVSFITNTICHF